MYKFKKMKSQCTKQLCLPHVGAFDRMCLEKKLLKIKQDDVGFFAYRSTSIYNVDFQQYVYESLGHSNPYYDNIGFYGHRGDGISYAELNFQFFVSRKIELRLL